MPTAWSTPDLLGYLDEVQVRGELNLVCESPQHAKRLRWALYSRRGETKVRVEVDGAVVRLRLLETPKGREEP